ncbi:MAG: rhodanese-like domain-containing protein [Flavobacteriaceae bacterium]|nr:rhodanese-like domain-containing protein [Flavobacteriaceae bacterium]
MDLSQESWTTKQTETEQSIIIDVRTPEEYNSGHLENAQLLNIREPQEFMNGLAALDSTKTYFIYCRSGARSAQACQLFKHHGISDCYNLLGGILEWKGQLES